MEGVEQPRGRGRWRFLALPLLPFLAAWELLKSVARAWGEFGVRMLDRLDPFFARIGAWWVRMGERLQPVFERIVAPFRWVAERVEPATKRIGEWCTVVFAPLRRLVSAVTSALAPAFAALRAAFLWVTTPLRWAGRTVARGWRATKAAAAQVWAAARRAVAQMLNRD